MPLERLREWLWRYLPLEIAAIATALCGGLTVSALTSNPVAIAYAGAWAENIGYYGLALGRELQTACEGTGAERRFGRVWTALRRLLWEFGMAEALDSFIVRPGAMFWASERLGSLGWGIIAGKLAADAVFYAIAIAFYELGKMRR
ncbi:MAG: hypothetical protein JSS20_08780 [Proteobacteria bacterium]|nr:hypothetical protein [Pseudomonadota bacterium]